MAGPARWTITLAASRGQPLAVRLNDGLGLAARTVAVCDRPVLLIEGKFDERLSGAGKPGVAPGRRSSGTGVVVR